MRTWSVELAGDWNDDTFNGTKEECIEFCKKFDYTIDGKTARLAEVEVDEDDCVTYCHTIIEEI